MKVLIDISEEMFKATQTYYSDNTTRLSIKKCIEKIANGTPISDNVTNGDMIKAMFPNVEIYTDVINEIVDIEICEDSSELRCSVEWWNAPYKTNERD